MKTVTRRGFVSVCLAAGALASGCLSPTLPPLPPPDVPTDMAYVAEGQLRLTGYVPSKRGLVFALNLDNGDIRGQQVVDNHYSFVLLAQPGDALQLWYEVGNDSSDLRHFSAPDYESADLPRDAADADAAVADAAVLIVSDGEADSSSRVVDASGSE